MPTQSTPHTAAVFPAFDRLHLDSVIGHHQSSEARHHDARRAVPESKVSGPAHHQIRPASGIGRAILTEQGHPGDYYRFCEINPLVLRLASTELTFLKICKARLDVTLGDGRLSLEREPPKSFDRLAADAFSSDAIPVHLLTREAFSLYFRHLKPDSVLAVNVSNRYMDVGRRASWMPGRCRRRHAWYTAVVMPQPRRTRMLTDDYSNLLVTLK